MAIPVRSLRSLASRAARRYQDSGLRLPGTKSTPKIDLPAAEAPEADILDTTNSADEAASNDPQQALGATSQSPSADGLQDRTEGKVTDGPSVSTSVSTVEPPSAPESDSIDEPSAEAQGATEENTATSLADILANPPPLVPSVDNLISKSIGNIFQKKSTKDRFTQVLLDGCEEIEMRDLADELREFAVAIGAAKS